MSESEKIDLPEGDANKLLTRLAAGKLNTEDYELLGHILKNWIWLSNTVQKGRLSIKELKKLIFGSKTEKTQNVLKEKKKKKKKKKKPGTGESKKPKQKGHGRNKADDYTGATRVFIANTAMKAEDLCLSCEKGKVYLVTPSKIVCISGQAPIQAQIYELEKLRCALCGKIFKAPAPPEAVLSKYDPSSIAMMGVLHYGYGLPFNRLEDLQANLGIPLPKSTQWDELNKSFSAITPVMEEMSKYAAMGRIFHNDDTTGRILDLEQTIADERQAAEAAGKKCRTGVFTTGIVSLVDDHHIALFFTGRKHAGENLGALLDKRDKDLPIPIQMCDALSRNAPKEFVRFLALCLCHGRREFVKLVDDYPQMCRYVLEILRDIFAQDAYTLKEGMSDQRRLEFHQEHSKPIMDKFHVWLNAQIDEKQVEPNGNMGGAIQYMLNHWEGLTLFLREPGAPIDNNICERALKSSIRYRNNSFFFKTEHGAAVGDMFMSFIHTCRLNKINAFEYIQAIISHHEVAAAAPDLWLPWNYEAALAQCAAPAASKK